MHNIEISAFAQQFPLLVNELHSRIIDIEKRRQAPIEKWRKFDDAYYGTYNHKGVYIGIFEESKIFKKICNDIYNENQEINNYISKLDIHSICVIILKLLFERLVPQATLQIYKLNKVNFKDRDLNYVLTNGKVNTKIKESFKRGLYSNIGPHTFIYPLFFLEIEAENPIKIFNCEISPNNDISRTKLQKDYSLTDNCIKEISTLKRDPELDPATILIHTITATANKAHFRSVQETEIATFILKLVIQKNRRRGSKSIADDFFDGKIKDKTGLIHMIWYDNSTKEFKMGQKTWDQMLDFPENAFSHKRFICLDNFFQFVDLPVRNMVQTSHIDKNNHSNIQKDIIIAEKFFKNSETKLKDQFKISLSFFCNSRREHNPILQAIQSVTSIESILMYGESGKTGYGLTKIFKTRLSNILLSIFNNDYAKINDFLMTSEINNIYKLQKEVSKIYNYRSILVHGKNSKTSIIKNNVLIDLCAHIIWYCIESIVTNKFTSLKELQIKIDQLA